MNEDLNRADDDDDNGYYKLGDNIDRPESSAAQYDIGFSVKIDAELEQMYDLRAIDRDSVANDF